MRLREKTSILRGQSGQSLVEYVLLILITVAILSIAGARLFKPIAKWMDFYMNDYTYCLLDSGELPQFAGGHPEDCEKLASENGFAANGGGGKGGAGSGKESEFGESSSSKSGDKSGRGSQSRGGRGQRQAKRGGVSFTTSRSSQDGKGAADATSEGDEDGGGRRTRILGGINTSGGRLQRQRVKSSYLSKMFEVEAKKAKKREEKISLVVPSESEGMGSAPSRLAIKPPAPRTVAQDTELDGSFDFGGMIRTILIIGVILVIVFVIGSQLNTISKSMEK
jgi:hypothetical protein